MKPKNIITTVLVIFVLVSIVYLAAKEIKQRNQAVDEQPKQIQIQSKQDAISEKTIVYYFRTNVRCVKCLKFESYTQQLIDDKFSEVVKAEQLEYKVINVEEPGNEHYINDYKLVTKSIILSKAKDGTETGWKNLDKIWVLVDDENAFKNYVAEETAEFFAAE